MSAEDVLAEVHRMHTAVPSKDVYKVWCGCERLGGVPLRTHDEHSAHVAAEQAKALAESGLLSTGLEDSIRELTGWGPDGCL